MLELYLLELARCEAAGRRETSPFSSSATGLLEQLDERTRELSEVRDNLAELLEQQTAMAQVLGIISRSPNDLRPVVGAILANATDLCEAVARYGATRGAEVLDQAHLRCVQRRSLQTDCGSAKISPAGRSLGVARRKELPCGTDATTILRQTLPNIRSPGEGLRSCCTRCAISMAQAGRNHWPHSLPSKKPSLSQAHA